MPQIIVLDTHIWIWFVTQEFELFPSHWRELIETANQVGISPVSCYIATALAYKAKLASIDNLFSQYSELETHLMRSI